ncbi:metallophosphoesterase family protein [Halorussus litoreus]|uniref:metallophosphoesterase family protein n=1 Tax=Halorussus litoreus TaxID=1710536 RepID=UPI000E27602B|nr:metallophosphoesterase family protein [Halorussus litoreus]
MDAQFRDRGVYLPDEDALVVADLHVGRDAASAVEIPLGERGDLTDRLADLLAAFDPAEVVVAGDFLHAFDRVPDGVDQTLADVCETVADAGAELVVVRGNHDPMLESMLDSRDITLREEYRVGDTVVHHGHDEPEAVGDAGEEPRRYVVGHDHPAIEIEGARHPCLLYGPGTYRGADVLVLPAFNRLAPGTLVNGMRTRDFQSPVVTDADAFRPLVWDGDAGEVLSFPPLGKFRKLL